MPKAEVGSTKYIANKMKSKGLQRLRWYCQACERQMRDENGFKCHVQSESHYRQMLVLGENPNKVFNDYSNQFKHDFVQLLRTSHSTKLVHMNQFYQEYIGNKEHVHMNSTKWTSLTEFAKFLGKEGVCRVEENEKGLHIAWVDNSPEALKRQDAIRKRERMDKGDEEREQKLIEEQIRRAQEAKTDMQIEGEEAAEARGQLQRTEGEKISLSFGKPKTVPENAKEDKLPTPPKSSDGDSSGEDTKDAEKSEGAEKDLTLPKEAEHQSETRPAPVKMSFGANPSKPKNVFATKKNPFSSKKSTLIDQPKKMSEAERIMKEEMERKRYVGPGAFGQGAKRQRIG